MKKYFLLLCVMFLMHGVFAQNVMRISFKDNTYKDYDVTTIDSVSWFFKEYAKFNSLQKDLFVGESFTQPVETNSDGLITYSSSNPQVASVDAISGEVNANSVGKAEIIAKVESTSSFKALEASYFVSVMEKSDNEMVQTGLSDSIYISKALLTANVNIPSSIDVFQVGVYCSKEEKPTNDNGLTLIASTTSKDKSVYVLQANNLEMNTKYYYVAYLYIPVTNTYYYGAVRSFTTENISEVTKGEAIDLGLSVKWCSHNLGSDIPEGIGEKYAWGELHPYSGTYAYYSNGQYIDIGNDICGTDYDVVKKQMGNEWSLPTYEQMSELFSSCAYARVMYNDIPGYIVEGHNRNSIFIPYGVTNIYSGYHTDLDGSIRHYYGDFSGFMTGQLSVHQGNKGRVYSLMFDYEKKYLWFTDGTIERESPQAIRPVKNNKR